MIIHYTTTCSSPASNSSRNIGQSGSSRSTEQSREREWDLSHRMIICMFVRVLSYVVCRRVSLCSCISQSSRLGGLITKASAPSASLRVLDHPPHPLVPYNRLTDLPHPKVGPTSPKCTTKTAVMLCPLCAQHLHHDSFYPGLYISLKSGHRDPRRQLPIHTRSLG